MPLTHMTDEELTSHALKLEHLSELESELLIRFMVALDAASDSLLAAASALGEAASEFPPKRAA